MASDDGPRDRRDVHRPGPVRVLGTGRLASRAAVHHQLRGLPGVVQGVELRHRRRQHLHVAARGADDHHDGGARGHLHAAGRRRTPNAPSTRSNSSPATTRTSSSPASCCERSTSRPAHCASGTRTAGSRLTHMGRSTIFMIATQTPGCRRPAADDHGRHHPPGPPGVRLHARRRRIAARASTRLPDEVWFDDANGTPDHRRHLAKHFAEEIRIELTTGAWHDLHRQRQDVRRGTPARAVPAHVRSLAGLAWCQKGLRRRRLRRLHRVARRRPRAQLHHARVPRRRTRGHHDRGPRHAREPAPDATAVPRRPRLPVRLLHRGHDHDLGDLHRGAEAGPAACAEGKSVPLHRISGDRGCDQRRRGDRECATGAGRRHQRRGACGDRRGHRQGRVHDGHRDGGHAASEGAALTACARPHRLDRQDPPRWRCPACIASTPGKTFRGSATAPRSTPTTWWIPTTPTSSTTSCASRANGWWPCSPRLGCRRRRGLPAGQGRLRGAARGLRPRGGDGRRRPPAAQLRRPVRPRQGPQHPARSAR